MPAPFTHETVTAISGRSKNDVWASGSGGLLMHWNGQQWAALESGVTETFQSLFLTSDETWATAGDLVLRRRLDGASVRTVRLKELWEFGSVTGFGISVLSNGETYIARTKTTGRSGWPGRLATLVRFEFETGALTPQPRPVLPSTNEEQTHGFRASFLVPDKALWLVGDGAAVARYPVSDASTEGDGGVSSLGRGVMLPIASRVDLLAAWGYGEHLFAAGRYGTVLHFDGGGWTTYDTGTSETLNAIFGLSPSDVWAAGDNGTVLHFDGSTWSPVHIGAYGDSLKSIWGSASDDVWIGGEERLFHWGPLP